MDLYSKKQLLWPQLVALRSLDGAASNRAVLAAMIEDRPELAAMAKLPPITEGGVAPLLYRLAWSRNALKRLGYIEKVSHGCWRLTDAGRSTTEREVIDAYMAAEYAMQQESLARKR